MKIALFVLSCVVCVLARGASSGCKVTLPNDIPINEPVYLLEKRGNYSLFTPTGRVTTVGSTAKLFLYCPGKKNSLVTGHTNLTKLECKSNQFKIADSAYGLDQLNCTKNTDGDIRATRNRCAHSQGIINEIGFKVTTSKFVPIIEVCYDNDTASVFYSHHVINGRAINYNVKEKERRDFSSALIPRSASPSKSYKKNVQILHFTSILGASQPFFNNTSFLSRGHLSPDADFVFTTAQFATYFYSNVAPTFQSVNGGNWVRVEDMARNLSSTANTDVDIYTGVYDQLSLPNSEGAMTALWMESDEKIMVPKWIWKVIINSAADEGIVMITLNNPFARLSEVQEFCSNVCSQAGIQSSQFKSMNKGYTICCTIDEFKRVVGVLPASVRARNLLRMS